MREFKSFCVSIFGKMTCMFRKNNVKSSYGYCKTIIAQKGNSHGSKICKILAHKYHRKNEINIILFP